MNYIVTIIVIVVYTMVLRLCVMSMPQSKRTVVPDPIEIEARRLAELEINEWCDHWNELLGLTPVKLRVMIDGPEVTPQQRSDFLNPAPTAREYWESQKVKYADPKAAASLVPLVLTGKPEDIHTVTWTPESFCLGCNKWTDEDEYHVHLYNNMGEVVMSIPDIATERVRK